ILFFAQHLESCFFSFKKKWVDIQGMSGYEKIETAREDIKRYYKFFHPPKMVESIIHQAI
ncbi:MAG: hypothetical protein AABY22_32100, partial [Nanoarchaeota archaeon]